MAQQTEKPWLRFSRAAAELMTRKAKVQEFVVKGGFTLWDLQEEIRAEAMKIPMLCVVAQGSYYPSSPWCANIIFPPDDKKGDGMQAIICASNGILYAIGFTVKDRKVTLEGEPRPVESLTEYEYIDDMIEEERAKKPEQTKSHPVRGRCYRYCQIRAEDVDAKSGTLQIAFSSESPGVQTATNQIAKMTGLKRGTEFIEILSHAKGDADFSALNNGGPFLDEHNTAMHLGSIKRAALSKDKKGRAAVKLDQITDLSKTRLAQMRSGSRPHVSVGYDLTKLVRTEKQGEQTAYVFAWSAHEISSVATPMDGTVGANRGLLDGEDEEDQPMSHCLDCGDEFDRNDLDGEFRCASCRDHKPEMARSLAATVKKVDSTQIERNAMDENSNVITEAVVIERETTALKRGKSEGAKALATRNKELFDLTEGKDGFVGKYGLYSKGKMADTIRALHGEYVAKDDSIEPSALISDFKAKVNEKVSAAISAGEVPMLSMRAKLRSQSGQVSDDDAVPMEYARYNLGSAMKRICARAATNPANRDLSPDGYELEWHQEVERAFKAIGGVPAKMQGSGGFYVPWDAPSRGFKPQSKRDYKLCERFERMQRDLYTGDYASGGALVPSVPVLPTIELLRNRMVLAWAGTKSLAGLTSNVWIPRQTSASAPQALAEIAQLAQTQQTFDQVKLEPHRVGNTQNYGRLLMLQSAPDIEALIRDDNFQQIALKIDELGINGQGVGAEPLGIFNTPGVGVVIFGGTATYSEIVSFETTIREQNVYDDVVYISTSSSRGRLMVVPAALIGSTIVSGSTNSLWTKIGGEEEIAGHPAFDSQQIPNNQMLVGAFNHHLHGQFGGLQVIVDPYTRAANDEIVITYNTYNDFAVRHAQAFCVSADAANQ